MHVTLEKEKIPTTLEEAKSELFKVRALKRGLEKELSDTVEFYKKKIRMFANRLFGQTSDSVAQSLFNEAELLKDIATVLEEEPQVENSPVSGPQEQQVKPPRKKNRKVIPDYLPRIEIRHDIADGQKLCPHDGSALHLMGEESREDLVYVPASIKVNRHIYPKYACRQCQSAPIQAKTLPRPIPGSVASPELLAHVAISKYLDHLPLYRQEGIFLRYQVDLSRTTLANWMVHLGKLLTPLANAIREDILEGRSIQADETPIRVLTIDGEKVSKKSYIWTMARWGPEKKLIYYEFAPSRSGAVAESMLETYRGYLQVDGYKGYDALCSSRPHIVRVGCMAHIRRKFTDFLKSLPKKSRADHPAQKILTVIKSLYEIEARVRGKLAEERYAERTAHSQSIFEKLEKAIDQEVATVAPASLYGDALRYAQAELPRVRNYLECGHVEIDNNLIENAIRRVALGKKNWLFADTDSGAQASATIYTILQTAKANGLNVNQYLTDVLHGIGSCKVAKDYEELLPYPKIN